jgi:RND superfamily putative drug exporter
MIVGAIGRLTERAAGHGGVAGELGIAIAAVVLLVTLGSLAAAGLPLLTTAISVGLGTSGIAVLASALNLSSTAESLALMLGLAVSIDYALFIVSRYREERGDRRSRAARWGAWAAKIRRTT